MTALPYQLDRTITIGARRETVFSFFTTDARWASWWGTGSVIDPRPGGRMYIKYPNGVEVSGEVVEVVSPERIIFTYGFEQNPTIGPGTTRVTIRLEAVAEGTRLSLRHEFASAADRDHHVQGWRYQLSVFANVVSDLAQANAEVLVDRWFEAWGEPDAARRGAAFSAIASPAVRFRDRFSHVDGLDELLPHVGATHQFMPGVRLKRAGQIRHCQGVVLANWVATGPDGQARGSGTNVFQLTPDGLIEAVTGLWGG
jgi:uncharacterized protein YndB with AHSA1/START domain